MVGVPKEMTYEPAEITIRLARAAGMVLKRENLTSATRTGPTKTSNGTECQDITVEFKAQEDCEMFLERTRQLRRTRNSAPS